MKSRSGLERMVREQIIERGIKDENVIRAMLKVERSLFVPKNLSSLAYDDRPLPIGEEQTISQPYMVALMTEFLELKKHDRVLEIGTGSGYQTAILAEIASAIYTVERIPGLLKKAIKNLENLEYKNIYYKLGDGTLGWEEFSPYDKIIVTAAAPIVPQPLFQQLKDRGRLVIPLGSRFGQELKIVIKEGKNMRIEDGGGCVFVPLIGEFGWKEGES